MMIPIFDEHIFQSGSKQWPSNPEEKSLHPWKRTCPLKINGWKISFLLKWSLFGGHVNFQGCNKSNPSPNSHPSKKGCRFVDSPRHVPQAAGMAVAGSSEWGPASSSSTEALGSSLRREATTAPGGLLDDGPGGTTSYQYLCWMVKLGRWLKDWKGRFQMGACVTVII